MTPGSLREASGAPQKAASAATESASADGSVERLGRAVWLSAIAAFAVIALPVVWRGAPLGDDFHNCVSAEELGLGGFFAASWRFMGAVRPARFAEILLTVATCRTLPFGVAIAVPLLLTFAISFQVRGLLRDLGTGSPWSDFGGAIWLFQPLGTEASLWPAALHVPLGLALALIALRLHCRGRHLSASLAAVAAALSVEQVILALPIAAWLVVPPPRRRAAVVASAMVAAGVLALFAVAAGGDARLRTGFVERISALMRDPVFLAAYPAVGLGMHSIPLAIQWTFPWSVAVLAAGSLAGALIGRRLPVIEASSHQVAIRRSLGLVVLIAVVNAPVVLNVPHYGSPRLFTPTWLLLSIGVPLIACRVRWRSRALLGAAAGACAAGAVLSLAFSVHVRLVTAAFNERAARAIGETTRDGARIGLCGVPRTAIAPAPRGAFSLHEFVYEWSAHDVLAYYTGRRATFELAGELWGRPCPRVPDVDVVISFDDLLARR